MRKDGIPYVQNPRGYYPPIDMNKLSLSELKQKFIKNCGKANGDVSVCSRCKTPCAEGKRAIQLVANQVYNDPPVPLYGGKTLIERAKEENKQRREAEEAKKVTEEIKKIESEIGSKAKRKYLKSDEWYEEAKKSGDPVKWLMDNYDCSRTQARKKVYYQETKEQKEIPVVKSEPKIEPEVKTDPKIKEEVPKSEDLVTKTLEQKIDSMTKKQAEYKAKMEEYSKKYEEITTKINVLFEAMCVMDDND